MLRTKQLPQPTSAPSAVLSTKEAFLDAIRTLQPKKLKSLLAEHAGKTEIQFDTNLLEEAIKTDAAPSTQTSEQDRAEVFEVLLDCRNLSDNGEKLEKKASWFARKFDFPTLVSQSTDYNRTHLLKKLYQRGSVTNAQFIETLCNRNIPLASFTSLVTLLNNQSKNDTLVQLLKSPSDKKDKILSLLSLEEFQYHSDEAFVVVLTSNFPKFKHTFITELDTEDFDELKQKFKGLKRMLSLWNSAGRYACLKLELMIFCMRMTCEAIPNGFHLQLYYYEMIRLVCLGDRVVTALDQMFARLIEAYQEHLNNKVVHLNNKLSYFLRSKGDRMKDFFTSFLVLLNTAGAHGDVKRIYEFYKAFPELFKQFYLSQVCIFISETNVKRRNLNSYLTHLSRLPCIIVMPSGDNFAALLKEKAPERYFHVYEFYSRVNYDYKSVLAEPILLNSVANKQRALFLATARGQLALVKTLANQTWFQRHRVNLVEARNDKNQSLLMVAAQGGWWHTFKYLFNWIPEKQKAAVLQVKDTQGCTVLHSAANTPSKSILSRLYEDDTNHIKQTNCHESLYVTPNSAGILPITLLMACETSEEEYEQTPSRQERYQFVILPTALRCYQLATCKQFYPLNNLIQGLSIEAWRIMANCTLGLDETLFHHAPKPITLYAELIRYFNPSTWPQNISDEEKQRAASYTR